LLIDSGHRKWFAATAVLALAALGVYAWVSWSTPGGLSGGSLVGMWYGLAGAALMVYAGLLSLLRRVPSWWWVGSRKLWLKGHIWLGLLSGVLILCHSGFRWGGPLERVLWVVVILTLATGVTGLVLQQILPHVLTTRIAAEAPYEQIPHLCAVLRRKADALVDRVKADAKLSEEQKARLDEFYTAEVRPFLAPRFTRSSPLAHPLQAETVFSRAQAAAGIPAVKETLAELAAFCDERRQLGEQERLHLWLHGWLLAHVPLSVILLVLGLAHAVMSLYY
jgi:hypothetical protein